MIIIPKKSLIMIASVYHAVERDQLPVLWLLVGSTVL